MKLLRYFLVGVSVVALSGCGQAPQTTKEMEGPPSATQKTSQIDAQKLTPEDVSVTLQSLENSQVIVSKVPRNKAAEVPLAIAPNVLSSAGKARDAARIADLLQIVMGLESYNADKSEYPQPYQGNCLPESLGLYLKDGKAPTDFGKNTIGGCPNSGYFYCKLDKNDHFLYLVAAKMEKGSEKVNAREQDLGKICRSEMNIPEEWSKTTGNEGFDVYAVVR